ncbi:CobW family GTP-binding protein [Crenalkalicoccus roseus]|uniref:CobW family GTP-binding protein n=1 Tax=Crenalkalicoccus roseus TaxID=1485588 RepID=UPI001305108E|nr:GTP-binding protein [Crenalkalicoccus roseus]
MRASGGLALPLTVLGGFLGAGKTTLVNALLRRAAGLRLAVLVNDFGSVNLDAALIASASGDTIALTNGCVCCAVGDDLAAGLAAVLSRRPAPDHVLVEASGVADPGAIAAIARLDPDLRLAGVLVLADAASVAERLADPRLADTLRRQLRAADLLVLTKTDLVAAEEAGRVAALLRPLAPGAALLPASHGALPVEVALGRHAGGGGAAPPPRAAHGTLFASVTLRPARPVAEAALRGALDALPEGVLRVKGVLPLAAGGCVLVQRVGRRLEMTPGGPAAEAALVLIGTEAVWDAAEALRPLGLARA